LGQREAIAFGDGVTLPVRIKFDELAKSNMPRSSTARFSERWQKSVGDEGFLESVVERWRASSSGVIDGSANLAMMADALGIPQGETEIHQQETAVATSPQIAAVPRAPRRELEPVGAVLPAARAQPAQPQ